MRTVLRRPAALLGSGLVIGTLALIIAGNAFRGATPTRLIDPSQLQALDGWWVRLSPLYALAFVIVGALIIARHPGNRVGWVASAIGLLSASYLFVLGYSTYGHYLNHSAPALGFIEWLGRWEWAPAVVFTVFFLPLLFPDGRPISPRWWLLTPFVLGGFALGFLNFSFGELLSIVGTLLANITLVIRYQRAGADERQQIRWFAIAALVLALLSAAGIVIGAAVYHNLTVVFNPYFDVLIPLAFTGLAASIGIAVLKYHLYDIDLFIRQAIVYGTLVALISVIYFAAVVGVGSRMWGIRPGDPGGAVAIGAIIAILFQPLRRALARLANRVVYGKRATPYDVLSRFSEQVGGMVATDELPRRMAQVLAEGTAADRATVWLRVGTSLRLAASWPATDATTPSLPLLDGQVPAIANATEAAPVQYQGELLGALAVSKREPMTPIERRLLTDLSRESGLVLKNARLTAELIQRLDELQASRERLVTAQDTERRRLERNIHDGAQQNLVALKLKIALAKRVAETDPKAAQAMLDELTGETNVAIETLRELARGLYPPVLAQDGLIAAVEAQARRMPMPVEVTGGPLPRYPQETEASVYFCVLEALQNVAKHAAASKAVVHFERTDARLAFTVSDDGRGMDPVKASSGSGMQNMRDRIEVLGGDLHVESSPGKGTSISGVLPVASSNAAQRTPVTGQLPAPVAAS